jgi:hypothetical protein
MIRRAIPLALCLVLVGLLAPAGVRGADPWTVTANTDEVRADFLTQSGSDASLYLENHVAIDVPGDPNIGAILDALGFGGGYSQEVSWTNDGSGTNASCPKGLADLFSFCHSDARGGWAIIPNGIRTELALAGSNSGSIKLNVAPSKRSLGYDAVVAAIGVALETLSPGVVPEKARAVADLAIKLLPEATSLTSALARGDVVPAGKEFLNIAREALKVIMDHAVDFAIGQVLDLIPGALWVRLGIATSKVLVSEVDLATHLLSGYSATTVTVGHAGGSGTSVKPTPTPPPSLNMWHWTSSSAALPSAPWYPVYLDGLTDGHVVLLGWPGHGRFANYVICPGDIVSGGGWDPTEGVVYDSVTGAWTPIPETPILDEADAALSLSNGRVLVVGLANADNTDTAKPAAAIYDAATNSWQGVSAPPESASSGLARLTDGRIVMVGGSYPGGVAPADVEAFDTRTNSWSVIGTIPALPGAGGIMTSETVAPLPDGTLLVNGENSANRAVGTFIFNPATGKSQAVSSGASPLWAQLAATTSGKVVGLMYPDPSTSTIRVAIFDPASATWSASYTESVPPYSTTILLRDGTAVTAGGRTVTGSCDTGDATAVPLATLTALDPQNGHVTNLPPLTRPDFLPTIVETSSGRLLFADATGTNIFGP